MGTVGPSRPRSFSEGSNRSNNSEDNEVFVHKNRTTRRPVAVKLPGSRRIAGTNASPSAAGSSQSSAAAGAVVKRKRTTRKVAQPEMQIMVLPESPLQIKIVLHCVLENLQPSDLPVVRTVSKQFNELCIMRMKNVSTLHFPKAKLKIKTIMKQIRKSKSLPYTSFDFQKYFIMTDDITDLFVGLKDFITVTKVRFESITCTDLASIVSTYAKTLTTVTVGFLKNPNNAQIILFKDEIPENERVLPKFIIFEVCATIAGSDARGHFIVDFLNQLFKAASNSMEEINVSREHPIFFSNYVLEALSGSNCKRLKRLSLHGLVMDEVYIQMIISLKAEGIKLQSLQLSPHASRVVSETNAPALRQLLPTYSDSLKEFSLLGIKNEVVKMSIPRMPHLNSLSFECWDRGEVIFKDPICYQQTLPNIKFLACTKSGGFDCGVQYSDLICDLINVNPVITLTELKLSRSTPPQICTMFPNLTYLEIGHPNNYTLSRIFTFLKKLVVLKLNLYSRENIDHGLVGVNQSYVPPHVITGNSLEAMEPGLFRRFACLADLPDLRVFQICIVEFGLVPHFTDMAGYMVFQYATQLKRLEVTVADKAINHNRTPGRTYEWLSSVCKTHVQDALSKSGTQFIMTTETSASPRRRNRIIRQNNNNNEP